MMAPLPSGPGPKVDSESKDASLNRPVSFWSPVPRCFPDERWRPSIFCLRFADFALLVVLAAFFVYLSHRPLWHTDLWGHLAYGRVIATSGAIPATEPLMPLCQGVPFVDFSWLSELLAYVAYDWRGAPALQFLYAASVTACVGLLTWCSRRKTGSAWAAALAAVIYVWVDWRQLAIVRPQLAGCLCFLVLWSRVASGASSRRRKTIAPGFRPGSTRQLFMFGAPIAALFALWGNLHGSFLIGLATIGAFVCGRALDLLRRTRSLGALSVDKRLRALATMLLVASVAVLLNPYGWRIYSAAWELSSNANLADLVEWKPLRLWTGQGLPALYVSVGLLGLYVLTPRRILATELLLLVGLGGCTLLKSRLIVWWGPVAAYYAALHAAAIWKRWRHVTRAQSAAPARTIPPQFALIVACIALLCTPLTAVLSRRPLADSPTSLSEDTPIGAAAFLRTHPPRGRLFRQRVASIWHSFDGHDPTAHKPAHRYMRRIHAEY